MFVCFRRAASAAVAAGVILNLASVGFAAPQQDKQDKKDEPASIRKDRSAIRQSPEKIQPADRSRISGRSRPTPRTAAPRKVTLTPQEGAKYVCEKTEVELEPIWRKSGTLTWDFHIKSGGTKPLKIKAKGG